MGKILTENPSLPKKRVAAYARVSLETDRLAHSLSAQKEYYSEYIANRPDWELVGIYADSFISGTQTARRTDFRRLIADCENGRIDLILCKSISRFARNTVDLLETVRHLNELGVEVRFEKENINSLSGDGELLLTILASFAQEESRSISENVKWGIRRRFRTGNAGMRNKNVLGYRYDGERYIIVPQEAEIVRQIFSDYIAGISLRAISKHLREIGCKTAAGSDFSHSRIAYIVRNEIYIGNIVLQKSFVKDFITHHKVKNNGELPQYRLYNCHEPIIDKKTFLEAQRETEHRAALRPCYSFSGKLICPKCERPFTRRTTGGKYACWHCRRCVNAKLKEDKLKDLFGMTDAEFAEKVFRVFVYDSGTLDVEFYDGRAATWKYE